VSYLSELLGKAGLVSAWELGETEGNAADAKDGNAGTYSVTPRDGTYVEKPTRAQASLLPNGEGKSVKFSGALAGGYIQLGFPSIADVFTLEAWVKIEKLKAGHNAIISRGSGGAYIRIDEAGTVTLLKSQIAGIVASTKKVTEGNTYHIVATKNGATAKIYVNGEVWAETTTSTVVCGEGSAGLNIGRDFLGLGSGTEFFHGTIQWAAQYHVALTAGEVAGNLAAASAAGYKAFIEARKGLVSLHECGEAEGKALDVFRRGFRSILPGGEGHSLALTEEDHVEVADANNLDVADNFTLQAWVKPLYPRPAAGKFQAIISRGQNGGYLRMNSSGKLELLKSQVGVILTSATALELDRAYKITAVKNGKVAKIYIDDALDAITEVTAVVCESNGNPLTIGADNFAGGSSKTERNGNMLLQYAAIYNTAIDPGLVTVKIMLNGKVEDKPRYVLVNGELLNR
jgi:uncharacterized protein YoxC